MRRQLPLSGATRRAGQHASAPLHVPAATRGGLPPSGSAPLFGPRSDPPGSKRPGDPLLQRQFQHAIPCHGRAVSAGRPHAWRTSAIACTIGAGGA